MLLEILILLWGPKNGTHDPSVPFAHALVELLPLLPRKSSFNQSRPNQWIGGKIEAGNPWVFTI